MSVDAAPQGSLPRERVEVDFGHQISPYRLFRLLTQEVTIVLVDLRREAGARPRALCGALGAPGPDWLPPADSDVVLFDQDGRVALPLARRLHARGFPRVRALFGGLDLWDLALGALEE